MSRSSHLRVKIKSLAAEARIIRHEEQRLVGRTERTPSSATVRGKRSRVGGTLRWMREHQAAPDKIDVEVANYQKLHQHRTIVVRQEARVSTLAYAYLRGKPYLGDHGVERPDSEMPKTLPGRVADLVARFGGVPKATADREVKSWLTVAPSIEAG